MLPRPKITISRWRVWDELDRPSWHYWVEFQICWVVPDFKAWFSSGNDSADLDDIPF